MESIQESIPQTDSNSDSDTDSINTGVDTLGIVDHTDCAYCRKNQNWKPKYQQQRSFGTEIINIGGGSGGGSGGCGGQFRGSGTKWGCVKCNIPLCKIGDCWRLWHENLN